MTLQRVYINGILPYIDNNFPWMIQGTLTAIESDYMYVMTARYTVHIGSNVDRVLKWS